ncbi:MAG: sensor histidine kinase [Gemmatimonadota bacterium]|nr:sensor histidine kinase [Gemmatimonadota bacterium]
MTRLTRLRLLPPDSDLGWTPFAWLIYFPALFMWPATGHTSTVVWIATICAGVIFLPLYFRGYWCRSSAEKLWIVAAIAGLGMLLLPVNAGAPVLTIYAASFAGVVRPTKRAAQLVALIVAAALVEAFVLRLPPWLWVWQCVVSIVVGFTNIHFATVRETNSQLRRAQEEIEHLAKVAERERIARDLHDLLGHTLSLITLKASLASRLADRDPARAIAEIRDVERISRDALTEVRAAVAGYREFGLAHQVASATSMLKAAGIELHTAMDPVDLTPAEETVFSLILREAVTNVVRHSHATHCDVTLSNAGGVRTMCIEDDGRGKSVPDGNGITGMRERVASLGGTLSVESFPGTRVRVTLAASQHVAATPESPARLTITA